MGFAARWTSRQRALDAMMEAASASSSKQVVDLALGDPDLGTDSRVINAAFADALEGYTHYAPARGDKDLLRAIIASWNEDIGITPDISELLVTASGCHALWLLLSAIIDPGDEVIIFSPYFSPYPEQIALAGGVAVELATDAAQGFTPDAEALRAACTPKTKAIIVNSPCNPTGRTLDSDEIGRLLQVCVDNNLLYIADDIYTAYAFNRPFFPAAAHTLSKGRVASIRSFSKDFCMSGWRIGYVVAPHDVVSAMLSINEGNVYVAPTISQRAAYHALALRREITDTVHAVYQDRMDHVVECVTRLPYLSLPTPQGGLYAFIDITKSGETSASFTRKLLEKYQVSVIPGTAFGSAGEGFVRMALRENKEVLSEIFNNLAVDKEWAK